MLRLLVEFVDGTQQRAVERVARLAGSRGLDVGVGQPRFLADLHVMRPLVGAVAAMCDAQDDLLADARPAASTRTADSC